MTDLFQFIVKDLIPLHGSLIQDSRVMALKQKKEFGVDIICTFSKNKKTLVFGSMKDKQDWVSMMKKVQESSLINF